MPIIIGARPESSFTNPIGLLSDCHRRIERFLDVLLGITREAGGQELSQEQRTALDTALRYFRVAAPKHTDDEEQSLFPRLRELDNPEIRSLLARVDSLEDDHVRANGLHQQADRLGQAWLNDGRLSSEQAARLTETLANLSSLYREHIGIEDHEIFPAAAAALSAADRTAIGSEMATRRGLSMQVDNSRQSHPIGLH
jgi:hemerythrin-like domain-containing protein